MRGVNSVPGAISGIVTDAAVRFGTTSAPFVQAAPTQPVAG